MARMDWEKAAQADRVRERGGERVLAESERMGRQRKTAPRKAQAGSFKGGAAAVGRTCGVHGDQQRKGESSEAA